MLPLFISLVFTMAGVGIYADSNRSLWQDVESLASGLGYLAFGILAGFSLVFAAAIVLEPFGF